MFEDAKKLADHTTLECDLCIIGAGAAGISIALQFIDSSFNVCVLESGGLNYNGSIQDLYRGISSGLRYRLKKVDCVILEAVPIIGPAIVHLMQQSILSTRPR